MLSTLVLMCAANIAAADCNEKNAVDFLVLPDKTPVCLLLGQQYAAQLDKSFGDGTYVKVICRKAEAHDPPK